MATEPYDVAAERDKLLKGWNPPPEDHTLERVVGVPTNPEDTAATAHVPMADRNEHIQSGGPMPHDSGVDAGLLSGVGEDDYTDDLSLTVDGGGNEGSYEDMTNDELRDELESRGLPKSGNKQELIDRLTEDDESDEGEEDES